VFAVVVSEKGGEERRETFDRSEVSVGRVQGNDIMLPKGNVSKRHARLLFRDGRFIVADLNSTNGTYVNRRRISQATIVREGDRVYVGDYVLRIEVLDATGSSGPRALQGSPPGSAPGQSQDADSQSEGESVDGEVDRPRVSGLPRVPAAPRVPSPARDTSVSSRRSAPPARAARAHAAPPSIPMPRAEAPAPRERGSAGQARALAALIERVSTTLDAGVEGSSEPFAARVDRLIDTHLAQLRQEGVLPSGVSWEWLASEARAELVDIGPLHALLADEAVSEITVVRFDHVVAMRSGRYVVAEPAFSSEAALQRAVAALCRRSSDPLGEGEHVIERALPGGARMWAAVEPAVPCGALLVIRKPRSITLTLDDLLRGGSASRAMTQFLELCVSGQVNLLVVGGCEMGSVAVTAALSSAGRDARLIAVQDVDDIASSDANVTVLSAAGLRSAAGELVRLAARVPGARLMVEFATSEMVEATIAAVGAGAEGVIALLRAPSMRRGLARLPAELVAARPGLSASAAREWVASAFDVVVEVRRFSDRRYRVTRIAEITGSTEQEILTDDVFRFEQQRGVGATVQGSYVATGVVPRVTDELLMRGVRIDRALFKNP
jgi:pilus assembly protein CpaF